ncbi:MAG: hypothetical protein V2A54_03420 [Bacteroidota bacterium]
MNASLILLIMQMLQPLPSDFSISYNYVAGSMPPPHHYEYLAVISGDGNGTIQFWPDYGSTPVWKETIVVEKANLVSFYSFLEQKKFFKKKWQEVKDRPVGGGHVYLTITAAGKDYKIPAFPTESELADQIRDEAYKLLPADVMKKLFDKHEEFKNNYKNGE